MFAWPGGAEEFLFVKSTVFISKCHVGKIQGMVVWHLTPERSSSNIVVLSVKSFKLRLSGG